MTYDNWKTSAPDLDSEPRDEEAGLSSYAIRREIRTRAGVRTVPVGLPAMGIDALSIWAEDADEALERARKLVADTRNLIATKESN